MVSAYTSKKSVFFFFVVVVVCFFCFVFFFLKEATQFYTLYFFLYYIQNNWKFLTYWRIHMYILRPESFMSLCGSSCVFSIIF